MAVAAAMPGSRSAPRAALLVEVLQQEAGSLSVGLAAHAADLASASQNYAEAEAWATSLTHGGCLPDVVTAGSAP